MSTGGGEVSPVATPFTNTSRSTSRPIIPSSWSAITSARKLKSRFRASLSRREPLVVLEILWRTRRGGTWTPDGRHLLFIKGTDLYQANPDGADSQKLISVSGDFAFAPAFSSDGTRFASLLRGAGVNSLWEIQSDAAIFTPLFQRGADRRAHVVVFGRRMAATSLPEPQSLGKRCLGDAGQCRAIPLACVTASEIDHRAFTL